jgi:hypothetical protein
MARSVVIAFEADRLGVVAANAIDPGRLPQAPQGMRQLPNFVVMRGAIRASGLPVAELRYLPLTSSRTKDWVALLDGGLNMVGWAPMDGF